jgi:DNA-directed RNA polymerase subunit M/transcription elongation factor TFIIS
MRFCDVCQHILVDITNDTELYYECTVCKKKSEYVPSDTLRLVQEFGKEKGHVKSFILNAVFDNANPKEFKECPECKNQITTHVIVGTDMKYIYLCECGNQF